MLERDYRFSHTTEYKSARYEHEVYKQGLYDDLLWQEEKKILAGEVKSLQKNIGEINYLDFACGTGRIIGFLEDKVSNATGIDPARSMLDIAARKIKKGELVEADITAQDILGGFKYNLITAFRFFLNAQPKLRALAFDVLATKLCDKNSLLIFNIHGNLTSYRLLTKFWYALRGRHLNAMTIWQARALINAHGLSVVRWYGIGILPKTFYRFVPASLIVPIDRVLEKVPGARYIAYDLIFICKKN